MRIQHNIAALNSYRNLTNNNSAVAKNLEKLSSGYRINRAGDDAAGLAISEKMRAQITGLKTAQKNANDGISLVQTAEGALTEVHSMLNRMVELANQSANGTYADAPDRENLQAEIDSLLTEIDRISQATNFNGINLLDGTLGMNGKTFKVGDTTPAAKAGTTAISSGFGAFHVGTEGATKQDPEFTVNFADLEVNLGANASATPVTIGMSDFKIGGQSVNFVQGVNNLASPVSVAFVQAGNASATVKTAADIATALAGKAAIIGDDVYSITADGTTGIKFTYEGRKSATNTLLNKNTEEGKVQDVGQSGGTWIPKGDVSISFTTGGTFGANGLATGGTATTTNNRNNCHLTKVKDPVEGEDAQRAGIKLEITADLISKGNLTIGKTTFNFVDKKAGDATLGANDIGIKGLTGDDLIRSVTAQLSSKTAQIEKEVDGTKQTFTFDIGRSITDGKSIEIEEQVKTDKKYGNFTEVELKAAFSYTAGQSNAISKLEILDVPKAGDSIKIGDKTYTFGDGKDQVKIGTTAEASATNLATKLASDGISATASGKEITILAGSPTADPVKVGSAGLSLQIGDTSDSFNRMTVDVKSMSSKSLGIDKIDISTQGGAQEAVDKIKAAIDSVSSQRGDLGAIQNRLEHTINNLSVTAENMTAAESRIRDVDMAEEMMAYTKNNILVQAAQAMLAQANQVPQGVLQLLQ